MNVTARRVQGFTLIELLVVIAIIAILASILFPVFAQAREKARQTACLSNEKQISLAILQYVQDYDETYPGSNVPNPGNIGNSGYEYLIDSYVKAGLPQGSLPDDYKSVFYCPDYDISVPAGVPVNSTRPSSSYAANIKLMPSQSYWPGPPATLASIQYPANQIVLAESEGVRYFTQGNDTGQDDGHASGAPVSTNPTTWYDGNSAYFLGRVRHQGGSNYALSDGHVKYFKAPSPSYTVGGSYDSQTYYDTLPVRSTSGAVYSHAQFPNAQAWFVENDLVSDAAFGVTP